jgi:hypothetical protein
MNPSKAAAISSQADGADGRKRRTPITVAATAHASARGYTTRSRSQTGSAGAKA